jgi:hypothetical protein
VSLQVFQADGSGHDVPTFSDPAAGVDIPSTSEKTLQDAGPGAILSGHVCPGAP